MSHLSPRCSGATLCALLTLTLPLLSPRMTPAQDAGGQPLMMRVSQDTRRMEMVVNSSRILTLDENIPRAQVNNPDILELTPLSPTQVQIFAKKPGVTQVNLWNPDNTVHSVDVIVYGDARELSMLLQSQFPTAALKVVPLSNSVVVSGYVDRPEQVSRVIRIAEDYYPKVINNINVGGVQQVLLHVKVMEISRTKLRAMGFDFSLLTGDDFLVSSVSGLLSSAGVPLGGDNVRFGIMDGNTSFLGVLEALRKNSLMKILAEPTLVTVSGRPASFQVGGEFPILVPAGLGTVSIEYKTFGTQVDFVPIVLGNGRIRLEVRPRVSELDASRGVTLNNQTVPGLNVRQVDTGVEMKAGQTLALAGLVQNRIEAENKGIPFLADLPYLGAPFRRVEETSNEIELLILVTPELVSAMDAHEVPPLGPGMHTVSPADCDLYWRGHIEVPNRHPPHMHPANQHFGPQYQEGTMPPGTPQGPQAPPLEELRPGPPPEPAPSQVRRQPRQAPTQAQVRSQPQRIPSDGRYADLYKKVETPRRVPASQPPSNVAPVRWTAPVTNNPQNRSNVSSPARNGSPKQETLPPGFIGPVGYDVHQ